MGEKRKRFTVEEINFLCSLVLEKNHVVENKQSDAESLTAKRTAWQEICAEFNEEAHTKRNVAQLMKCWDNIKTKRKKEMSEGKGAWMMTGGGKPAPPSAHTEEDNEEAAPASVVASASSEGKWKAPRTLVAAAEIEERAKLNAARREQERELHKLRVAELETRLAIAKEDLKRTQQETKHKEKLWRMEEKALEKKLGSSSQSR